MNKKYNLALGIMRSFRAQYPRKYKRYTNLLKGRIPFPESVDVWGDMILYLDLILKLAREEE